MAERNKFVRSLGGHYTRNSGDTERISLLDISVTQGLERISGEPNRRSGPCTSFGCLLSRDIDHSGITFAIEMSQGQMCTPLWTERAMSLSVPSQLGFVG